MTSCISKLCFENKHISFVNDDISEVILLRKHTLHIVKHPRISIFRKHPYSVKCVVNSCAPDLRRHFYFSVGLCFQINRWIRKHFAYVWATIQKPMPWTVVFPKRLKIPLCGRREVHNVPIRREIGLSSHGCGQGGWAVLPPSCDEAEERAFDPGANS